MARYLLSDRKVRNAKPAAKPYRLFDGDGLALWISPTGARSWQFRYWHNGTHQTATLGKLERLTLAEARAKADELRKFTDGGEHLATVKRAERMRKEADAVNTFQRLADAWRAREARRQRWSPAYVDEVEASIKNHLGDLLELPLARITAPVVAPVLAKMEERAPMMFEKVRPRLYAVMDYAVELGAIPTNPLPRIRKGRRAARRHYPAVTDLPALGAILRAARAADACKAVLRAHSLLAFTAQRPGEVTGAKWAEFDLDAEVWRIPRERMKMKDPARGAHVVPLPPELLEALREWREADGFGAVYVCPTPRNPAKYVTEEGIEKFYRNVLGLAGKHSPHSWRAAFSTVAREAGKDDHVIEAQLDHITGNKVAAAYDRARRVELQRVLMRWYESQLIAARDGAKVLPMRAA
jgi:integrase